MCNDFYGELLPYSVGILAWTWCIPERVSKPDVWTAPLLHHEKHDRPTCDNTAPIGYPINHLLGNWAGRAKSPRVIRQVLLGLVARGAMCVCLRIRDQHKFQWLRRRTRIFKYCQSPDYSVWRLLCKHQHNSQVHCMDEVAIPGQLLFPGDGRDLVWAHRIGPYFKETWSLSRIHDLHLLFDWINACFESVVVGNDESQYC